MYPTPLYLRNHEAVVNAFGYWPTFHDAQVLAFRQRKEAGGEIDMTLHGWEMTPDVDERGYFKLIKHHLIRFVFREISNANLPDNNFAVILFQLDFSSPEEFEINGMFKVRLESAMGPELSASFSARTGEVLKVIPCEDDWIKSKSYPVQ